MNRVYIVLTIIILTAAIPIPASAFDWGIRGGVNLVDNKLGDLTLKTVTDRESYTGFFAGPMMEMHLPLGFSIDMSLLYSEKGIAIDSDESIRERALTLPLLLRFQFNIGRAFGIFANAGPQFGIHPGNLSTTVKGNNDDELQKSVVFNRTVWNMNLGGGLEFFRHLQLAINYCLPMSDEGSFRETTGKVFSEESFNSSTLQFILTYKF